MTRAIHSLHAATLPMLESLRSRLPLADQASAHISTDCLPDHDDQCAIQMTVRPAVLKETLVLSIVVSVEEGHLELGVQIQDVNNSSYAAFDLLHPVSHEVVADLETAIRAVEDGLPRWVSWLVPLLDRERVYAALPFAPDWRFRTQSVSWFDREERDSRRPDSRTGHRRWGPGTCDRGSEDREGVTGSLIAALHRIQLSSHVPTPECEASVSVSRSLPRLLSDILRRGGPYPHAMNLPEFLSALDERRIPYRLDRVRDAIMVLVATPGERWEVEFLDAGGVEVERFRSDGSISSERALDDLLAALD